jgi:hypothetical protein
VKCYNGTFRALADYSVNVKKYQKHFWRHCRGTVAVVIFEPSLLVYLFFYLFFFYPFLLPWKTFLSKTTIVEANHSFQLHPGFVAMVREQTFLGYDNENPYHHLREFEQLCSCLSIVGMAQETLQWKLFPFSLNERGRQWYAHNVGKVN